MEDRDPYIILKSLTPKQHEALALASRHLTSKQIARQLGVAPVTIDKRIEAVRAKFGAIPRTTLLQLYGEWCERDDPIIADPIILAEPSAPDANPASQSSGSAFVFEDRLVLEARAPWDRTAGWRRPGFSPSDFGVVGKLVFITVGAVAMLMAAVLSMAFANALILMFEA